MCQWALLTLTNVRKTLEYMAYLGYNMYNNECQTSAVVVTREKKVDLAKKQSSRNVYTCHVIGPKSSGKTTLCRTFIDPKLEVKRSFTIYQNGCWKNLIFHDRSFAHTIVVEIKRPNGTTEFSHHCKYVTRIRTGENDSVEGYQRVKRPGRTNSSRDTV